MELNEWIVFGEFGEYRANANGKVETKVRKGKPICGGKGKRIVQEWQELLPYKSRSDKSGGFYYNINASINGKSTTRLHALICTLFHGSRPAKGYEVDHIDGNRNNNSSKNLRWVTHKQNMEYAKQRGAWKKLSEASFKLDSEFEFLSIMTQLNAGIEHKEMSRRYKKDQSTFSRLHNMKKQVGFIYRHKWLSNKICKNDYFGGEKDFLGLDKS